MMEDELEDNAAMMVEDGAEAATRFSKMEIDCRFEENHVIERLTNDSCYVSRKLATNRNVPGNRDLNDFPFSPELSQVDTKLEVVSGMRIVHYTDNQAVKSIIEIGSKKPHLLQIALDIFHACKEKKIRLTVEWKPRDHPLLQHADFGSKSFDESAYSLDFNSFLVILEFFNNVTIDVDVMANDWNKKSNFFFSKLEEWGSSGVNFFSQKLDSSLSYYCFPPPSLIVPAILHFYKFRSRGLLVIPVWKSAAFWSNVVPDGRHLSCWAKKHLVLKPTGFVSDSQILSSTFKNPPTFDMLIIQFDLEGVLERDLFKPVLSHESH